MSTEELSLCKCGCGDQVTKATNKYIKGHYNKKPKAKEETPTVAVLDECAKIEEPEIDPEVQAQARIQEKKDKEEKRLRRMRNSNNQS